MAKVLISIDDALLERVDQQAKRYGLSRSAYFATLARFDAEQRRRPDPKVTRSIERVRRLVAEHARDIDPSEDTTAFIRRMRDER